MSKAVEFLNENPIQYLATVGRDGKAKCRPFMFAGEVDGKLWFCTNNTKDVYKDMQENPEIEISVSSPSYAWIRLHGTAVFENNMAVKEVCMQNPIVKGQYQTADLSIAFARTIRAICFTRSALATSFFITKEVKRPWVSKKSSVSKSP